LYRVKVTSKGQVTIPIELRNKIGIKPGNYLEIKETEAGYVIQKQVDGNCLEKYVGILNNTTASDKVIKELRGE